MSVRQAGQAAASGRRMSRYATGVGDALLLALQQTSAGRAATEVEEILKIVNQVPILVQLSPKVRWALCEQVRAAHYRPGEVICRQGDVADKFYFLLSGSVQIYHEDRAEGAEPGPAPADAGAGGAARPPSAGSAAASSAGSVDDARSTEAASASSEASGAPSPTPSAEPAPAADAGPLRLSGKTLFSGEAFGHSALTTDEVARAIALEIHPRHRVLSAPCTRVALCDLWAVSTGGGASISELPCDAEHASHVHHQAGNPEPHHSPSRGDRDRDCAKLVLITIQVPLIII